MSLPLVDESWTLFLDRDGVLNRRIVDGYVLTTQQFEWLPGVLDALRILTHLFGLTVIVTNQQGIGKGLMTQVALDEIHSKLLQQAEFAGAKIDAIYSCGALATAGDINRKPGVGMAQQAQKQFAHIDFGRSMMVGDSHSDMAFGRAAGMHTVFIGQADSPDIDCCYANLWDFAVALVEAG